MVLTRPERRGRRRKTHADRAVAYVRVSTGRQELGPEAQREAIERYAKAQGVTVVAWFEETVSGKAPLADRPVLFDAIETARKKRAGTLLVARRDRIARDSLLTQLLARDIGDEGIELMAADTEEANGDSLEAQLLRRLLDALAEYERGLIAARTRAALAARRRQGLVTSSQTPYGTRLGKDGETLLEDRQEAKVLARVLREADDGATIQAIVDGLNADRVPARGKRWHRTTVARILSAHGRR